MHLRLLRLFLTFAMLSCLSLHAKDITSVWFADGKFLEESASQRMTNDFGGRLDFTDDPFFILNPYFPNKLHKQELETYNKAA